MSHTSLGEPPTRTGANQEPDEAALESLYADLAGANLIPLWTQLDELMPQLPRPATRPHRWHWDDLVEMAVRSGELVPVGRGGERRAIALANPGLGGAPFATPTLWAAVQYLKPGETAPEHRHTQNAFRFVLEGAGVWTVVNGDPVAMSRGDFLLTPGWHFHGHHNVSDGPMAWLDGLDIPLIYALDGGFFDFGSNSLSTRETPARSRSERLWAYPGLLPTSVVAGRTSSPIACYRWEHTDRALSEQLELEDEGYPGVLEPGHASVRFSNPTTGGDVMPTIRAEFHRLRSAVATRPTRAVGSSVWQVFAGEGTLAIDGSELRLRQGDLFVVPSWVEFSITSTTAMDLFRFSDAPVFEALGLARPQMGGR